MLCNAVLALGGRITSSGATAIEAQFGSRLAYRLLGAVFAGGAGRVPLRLCVTTTRRAAADAVLHAELYDNKGWYLNDSTPIHDRTVAQRVAQIIEGLRAATAV